MRSRIIEFIGAPGVGKSSIYKSLCKTWHPGKDWVYPEALLEVIEPSHPKVGKLVYNSARWICRKRIHHVYLENDGIAYIRQNERLAKFCWDHFHNADFPTNNDIGSRFRSIFYLYRHFCKYHAIQNTATEKVCVLDEGFLQKSFLIHKDTRVMETLLCEYLTIVPLPCAIFWIYVDDIKEIVHRLRKREKTIDPHIGLDNQLLSEQCAQWQNLHQLMVNYLRGFNIEVFQMDGRQSVTQSVQDVQKKLRKFVDGQQV